MSLLPSTTELAAISTLEEAVTFVGLAFASWQAVNESLGNAQSTRVLAGLPAGAIRHVIVSAIVPSSTSGPGRSLTPVDGMAV